MKCPHCRSEKTVKNGMVKLQDQSVQQRYLCQACGKRFNERTHTPMARLRTPSMADVIRGKLPPDNVRVVSAALNVRTEGLGVRATGRSFGKAHSTSSVPGRVLSPAHSTIMRWERRLAVQASQWSPSAPEGSDVTIEGDEVYTRVGENLPPL